MQRREIDLKQDWNIRRNIRLFLLLPKNRNFYTIEYEVNCKWWSIRIKLINFVLGLIKSGRVLNLVGWFGNFEGISRRVTTLIDPSETLWLHCAKVNWGRRWNWSRFTSLRAWHCYKSVRDKVADGWRRFEFQFNEWIRMPRIRLILCECLSVCLPAKRREVELLLLPIDLESLAEAEL